MSSDVSRNVFRRPAEALTFLLCSSIALAQAPDIIGWHDISWGTAKSVALTSLQPLGVHESSDELVIDVYRSSDVTYKVNLRFDPKLGLNRVIMNAADTSDSFAKALAELTARYGKPGLRSEYDGEQEVTRTQWIWTKAHGAVVLASEDGENSDGLLKITYERK